MPLQEYSRTEAILGKEAVEKLNIAKVLIAGLGGVGGYALEALARSGVKNFILIDADTFDVTNLNRQLLCTSETIGKKKTEAAKERLKLINPEIEAETICEFIDEHNIDGILSVKPNLVVDAIDSTESKAYLLAKCREFSIPVVSSMGAALKKDPTKIRTADISETSGDPLAKKIRYILKNKYGIESGIECVYSPEKCEVSDMSQLGSLVTVTGSFGLALAQLALNRILG